MRSIASVSTWPWAPAPSRATLISCRSPAAAGAAAASSSLRLLVPALLLPRVPEQTQRGDRGQPHQHVAPIELPRPCGPGLRRLLVLLVLTSHRSSPGLSPSGFAVCPRVGLDTSTAGRLRSIPAEPAWTARDRTSAQSATAARLTGAAEVKQARSACGPSAGSAGSRPRGPGLRSHSASISSGPSSMKAVVSASATAAAATRGPPSVRASAAGRVRPRHRDPGRAAPAGGLARARVHDVIALAQPGGPERRLAHREAGEHRGRARRGRSA